MIVLRLGRWGRGDASKTYWRIDAGEYRKYYGPTAAFDVIAHYFTHGMLHFIVLYQVYRKPYY